MSISVVKMQCVILLLLLIFILTNCAPKPNIVISNVLKVVKVAPVPNAQPAAPQPVEQPTAKPATEPTTTKLATVRPAPSGHTCVPAAISIVDRFEKEEERLDQCATTCHQDMTCMAWVMQHDDVCRKLQPAADTLSKIHTSKLERCEHKNGHTTAKPDNEPPLAANPVQCLQEELNRFPDVSGVDTCLNSCLDNKQCMDWVHEDDNMCDTIEAIGLALQHLNTVLNIKGCATTAPVTDPCNPNPCPDVRNTDCIDSSMDAMCVCKENRTGNPYMVNGCQLKCNKDADCGPSEGCTSLRCKDACEGACNHGATCTVNNHRPVCTCPDGTTGDKCINAPPATIDRTCVKEAIRKLDRFEREEERLDQCASHCHVDASCMAWVMQHDDICRILQPVAYTISKIHTSKVEHCEHKNGHQTTYEPTGLPLAANATQCLQEELARMPDMTGSDICLNSCLDNKNCVDWVHEDDNMCEIIEGLSLASQHLNTVINVKSCPTYVPVTAKPAPVDHTCMEEATAKVEKFEREEERIDKCIAECKADMMCMSWAMSNNEMCTTLQPAADVLSNVHTKHLGKCPHEGNQPTTKPYTDPPVSTNGIQCIQEELKRMPDLTGVDTCLNTCLDNAECVEWIHHHDNMCDTISYIRNSLAKINDALTMKGCAAGGR